MSRLYEITGEILSLLDMAYDEDDEAFNDTLEALQLEQAEAIESLTKLVKNINGDIKAMKDEEARLERNRKTLENKVERINSYIFNSLKATNTQKLKTTLFSFTIKKNPPAVKLDVDEDKVPKAYRLKQPDKINKTAIKELLASGKKCKFAHLEQSESLQIR